VRWCVPFKCMHTCPYVSERDPNSVPPTPVHSFSSRRTSAVALPVPLVASETGAGRFCHALSHSSLQRVRWTRGARGSRPISRPVLRHSGWVYCRWTMFHSTPRPLAQINGGKGRRGASGRGLSRYGRWCLGKDFCSGKCSGVVSFGA